MKLKLYLIFFLALCQQISAQNNYYWVGGAGSWSDLNHWRIGSSAGPQATIIPSRYDNVFFNSSSGFTASGGTLNVSPSATCKNFIMDDNFTGKMSLPQGSVFNIYGHLKLRGNVGAYYNLTLNLYSDSANPDPNSIDIPGNLIDPAYIYSSYGSYISFLGNGSFKLEKDFNSNGYFIFNIDGDAALNTNNKNITVTNGLNHTSTAVSDFGTSVLTNTGGSSSFNAKANLTQATVSSYNLLIPTTQTIKNIILKTGGISVGTLLKADNITGTEGGRLDTSNGTGSYDINTINLSGTSGYTIGSNIANNIASFKANMMTLGDGNNNFFAASNTINNLTLGSGTNTFVNVNGFAYNINNLTLNSGNCNFNTTSGNFNVNQTLVVNPVCKPVLPTFGGGSQYAANLVLPTGINGSGIANFPGYIFTNVKLTGGGSANAAINNGGNTGSISYTGAPAAKTFYRIGGGGAWADPAKWSLSSGGAAANCVPTMYDDVIFDSSSGFTTGNNAMTSGSGIAVRNMTWSNAPGNPVYNINATTVYGSLYLQKDMTATAARFILQKYNSADPVSNRYMSFEGQAINYVAFYGNDNFYIVPASWAAAYDVTVTDSFLMDNSGLTGAVFADGIKINGTNALVHVGGNSASMDHAVIRAKTLYLLTRLPINAPNASVYVSQDYNGAYLGTSSNSHFIGSVYKEGAALGSFTNMKASLFQVNAGMGITFYNANAVKDVNITAPVNIIMNSGSSLKATDTFTYNRANCDNVMTFTGYGGNNLILGNNINGNGLVELNRMQISGINAVYVTPVAGAKPVNANNSIDNGNNSGINFTIPVAKNFYWKGGSGSWNDLAHWSLDPTSARVTANCGLPTIYDNVFFDQYSGFLAGAITGIQLDNTVTVNDMTFSGLPATAQSYFSGNNNYYNISINGDLTLHPRYYDAGYFSGFTFINTGKAAGINKSVYPNGANSSFIFNANANWKIYHGTGTTDMSGGYITQNSGAGTVDLSNTILKINTLSFSGKEVLLSGSDITASIGNVSFNTQLPVISNNSVLRIFSNSNNIFSSNNLAHYFERIDITSDIYSSYGKGFSFPGGVINYLNVLPSVTNIDAGNYSVSFSNLEVNNLNIQKRNIINFSNIKVNQSMVLQGGCTEAERLIIQSGTITIPSYNSTNFVIDKVRLKNTSSSGGQTYITSNSKDLGGNTGFSFPDAISSVSRNLYWVGGAGDWNDASHWSLSSGSTSIVTCDPPRANDNVFFDQNSGFTPASKTVTVSSVGAARNVTFNSDPNSPVVSSNLGNMLNIYGNFVTQSNTVFSISNTINIVQSQVPGQTRDIDTKGIITRMNITAGQDNFELKSAYRGDLRGTNVKSFKTNDYPVTINTENYFSIYYDQNINPTLDFGQSIINVGSLGRFEIFSNNTYPVTINAVNAKITTYSLILNIPNVSNFGEVNITQNGTLGGGPAIHQFSKVTFLGSGTLSSKGNYKTLYFNPGTYTIASGQTVTENLFMTGTPCNRINVSRTSASGQSLINLDPAAVYTMFYASVKDINFSRPVNAYGNSQDLGNTNNFIIVPTNVQAAGFGGNKTLCASEFPKTYDAATLFGTDPNASYTWTKIGNPNAGIVSTSSSVTFTQAGSYRVSVVYAQDGCNITENFTITSVTLPVDNTTAVTSSALQSVTGDVAVTFKGSLTNQTYIFTYSINNGSDLEVTSNANGVATILHPKNVAGTFVYYLKSVRFASGTACPVAISNKNIIVNINPECTTPGVVRLYGTELRGCTASMGARRLAEVFPPATAVINPPSEPNVTKLIPGTGVAIKEGADVFLLRNYGASLETLVGLPAGKPHVEGSVIYHNDHFYEGVENGKWIRIDNE